MLRGEEWLDARKLFESGVTITEIASRLGHDRKTIRRCLSGDHPPVADRRHGGRVGSVLDPYKSYILQRMDFGVLNAVRLFREIRPMGYEGGLTTLRDFMRPHRPLAQAKVTRRFETPPGKQAQIDLGAFRYLASDEKVRTVYCFAMVLSFSRMLYVEFIERADQMGILTAMRRAFEFFGGVCEEILSDNCSPLVLSNDGEGNVVWQEAYLDFARHFGFIPRACRPYRARTKGKIERPIRYIRQSFWPVEFSDIADLNRQARAWQDGVANARVHGTTHEVPLERFSLEKLLGMPSSPFVITYTEARKVSLDCFISWNANRYSVPWKYAGQEVYVRQGESGLITIEHAGEVIARHQVLSGRGKVSEDKAHYMGMPRGTGCVGQGKALGRQLGPVVEERSPIFYELIEMGVAAV